MELKHGDKIWVTTRDDDTVKKPLWVEFLDFYVENTYCGDVLTHGPGFLGCEFSTQPGVRHYLTLRNLVGDIELASAQDCDVLEYDNVICMVEQLVADGTLKPLAPSEVF